jgi:hypothetical protein
MTLAVLGAGSFIFNDTDGTVFQVTAGVVSGGIAHNVIQYWVFAVSSTTVLAVLWNVDDTISTRIISAVSNLSQGPIGLTASAVSSSGTATIVPPGQVCANLTGLTPGLAYYHNGDGTVTTANTGHLAGTALTSTTLLVA